MSKYNIEGGIKFYEELYKMLDNDDKIDYTDCCLITSQPLTENYVTLECNHKFNYLPLFNDIKTHKKKFNSLESQYLKQNEIRCPYCRNKQKKLLPYHESMGTSMKVVGVNAMPEPPPGYQTGICCFDDSNYCSSNVMMLDLNNKTYCASHYYFAKNKCIKEKIKKEKAEAKQKEKEEAKKSKEEEKQKAKEEAKKAKEEAKKNAKEESKKKKQENGEENNMKKKAKFNNPTQQSEIICENIVINVEMCNQLIKSGLNKGQQCKCKVYKDLMCTRHYNSFQKTNEN
jgi:flagellar biosynthesis GTPase FlhF